MITTKGINLTEVVSTNDSGKYNATKENIVDLNRDKVCYEDFICEDWTNSFQNSRVESSQGTEDMYLVQGTEDNLGIKIDVVKMNKPTLDFDICGREWFQEDIIWNSGHGVYGKVCFGKKGRRLSGNISTRLPRLLRVGMNWLKGGKI